MSKKKKQLTAKQEKYIAGLVEGLSQRQAYINAYDTSRMSPKTIDNKASLLFKQEEIRVRYQEILNEHKAKALYTKEQATKDLIWIKETAREDIVNKGLKQGNGSHFLKAVSELCVLEDLYPKEKQENTLEEKVADVLEQALKEI